MKQWKDHAFWKLWQLIIAVFTASQWVLLVMFLFAFVNVSEPCDGQPDFDVLDQVHGLVINYLIFTLIATFCHCTFICAVVEIQRRMWSGAQW